MQNLDELERELVESGNRRRKAALLYTALGVVLSLVLILCALVFDLYREYVIWSR